MEMQYFKDYSPALGRDMECKIYGHAGRPMLFGGKTPAFFISKNSQACPYLTRSNALYTN